MSKRNSKSNFSIWNLEIHINAFEIYATKSFRVCSVKFITVSLYYTYKKPVLIVSRGRGYLKPITAKLSEIEPFWRELGLLGSSVKPQCDVDLYNISVLATL